MASVAAPTDRPELGTGLVGALAHEQYLLGMSGHACPQAGLDNDRRLVRG